MENKHYQFATYTPKFNWLFSTENLVIYVGIKDLSFFNLK